LAESSRPGSLGPEFRALQFGEPGQLAGVEQDIGLVTTAGDITPSMTGPDFAAAGVRLGAKLKTINGAAAKGRAKAAAVSLQP
jgi:hypothetical protein